MAVAQTSGYLAEAQTVSMTGTRTLVSLASDEWTDLSDIIDNSLNKFLFADIMVDLGSAAFTGSSSALEIYLLPSVDGTNYPDWTGDGITDLQEHNVHHIGSVTTSGTTAAQSSLTLRNVNLPPGKFKLGFRNKTGVALAASGNTVKWRPHGYASS